MSADALEVVRRYRAARAAGDHESALALLAPDVEYVQPRGTLRGLEAVRAAWSRPQSKLDHLDSELEVGDLESLGDGRVGADSRRVYRWRESGEVAYDRRQRIEYTVRDGRIARYEARIVEGAEA